MMPNWCESDLRITGVTAELKKFKETAQGENGILDMNSFIPYPEEWTRADRKSRKWHETYHAMDGEDRKKFKMLDSRPDDGYNHDGYEWCIKNWGTKWNFCDIVLEEENYYENETYDNESELFYTFETAWAPPRPVILAMSKAFPELEFDLKYFEMSMGFNGWYRVKAGETLDDERAKYYGRKGG
jgi:hypothetical protein